MTPDSKLPIQRGEKCLICRQLDIRNLVGSAGGSRGRTAVLARLAVVASRRRIEPCMRFSRTRLSDIVHRLADAVRGPGLTRSIAAGDLVDESVELMLAILFGTAVEHATESMNLAHTQGAADGSSRYGTHQVLLLLPVHR